MSQIRQTKSLNTSAYHKKEIQSSQKQINIKDQIYETQKEFHHSQTGQRFNYQHHNNQEIKIQIVRLIVQYRLKQMGFSKQLAQNMVQTQMNKIGPNYQIPNGSIRQLVAQMIFVILCYFSGENRAQAIAQRNLMFQKSEKQNLNLANPQKQLKDKMIKQVQQKEQQLKKQIFCNICCQITNKYVQLRCKHQFCKYCMRSYVRENIKEGNYLIDCAQSECKQLFTNELIKQLISKQQYKKYEHFKLKILKELDPNNIFCITPDCDSVLVQNQKVLRCQKCKKQYCKICQLQKHQGNCIKKLNENLDKGLQQAGVRKCPGCSSPIQKSQGCNHMTCKKCKYEFCWICLGKYSIYHYKYYNCFGCPGMQYQNEDMIITSKIKQVLFYLVFPIITLLALIFFVLLLPFYVFYLLISKPLQWMVQQQQFCQGITIRKLTCIPNIVQSFLIWLAYQPRSILYSIFIGPLMLVQSIFKHIRDKIL